MKLIMTKGLPGSGKSTWAKEQLKKNENWKRVNKDELRRMIDDGKWSGKNEQFILGIRDEIIEHALAQDYSIISDDTNLDPKHEARFRQLARQYGASLVIEDSFLQVPLETCIARDLNRLESVGAKVIRDMHEKYIVKKFDPPIYDPALPPAIICDLDGTLALFGKKNPYNRDFINDEVNKPVADILKRYYDLNQGYNIIFLSGREKKFENETRQWLINNNLWFEKLYMRETDDTRNDTIVKEELYRAHIEGKYNVFFVLDDRNRVVDLWRRLGLKCFQVAPGDF